MIANTKIKIGIISFVSLLILSGITAFPVQSEINFLHEIKELFPLFMQKWILELHQVISETPEIIFYGTDWLAFAHIIIALFFIPVYKNPIAYQMNLKIAMLACLAVFPLAFICGPIRGIPFFHQLIDCSFGIIGFLFLLYINKQINFLKHEQ